MNFMNLYSGLVMFVLLIAAGAVFIARRGGGPKEWGLLAGLAIIGALVWIWVRPVQSQEAGSILAQVPPGKMVLLEFQSPY